MTAVAYPPPSVIRLLRLEGLAIALAAIAGFWLAGANGWLFLLVLAPDLSFLGMLLGRGPGAVIYNLAHTYLWPALLVIGGLLVPSSLMLPLGLIWIVHIGVDRALGYGLKYPGAFWSTHLGPIGKAKGGAHDADAR